MLPQGTITVKPYEVSAVPLCLCLHSPGSQLLLSHTHGACLASQYAELGKHRPQRPNKQLDILALLSRNTLHIIINLEIIHKNGLNHVANKRLLTLQFILSSHSYITCNNGLVQMQWSLL